MNELSLESEYEKIKDSTFDDWKNIQPFLKYKIIEKKKLAYTNLETISNFLLLLSI